MKKTKNKSKGNVGLQMLLVSVSVLIFALSWHVLFDKNQEPREEYVSEQMISWYGKSYRCGTNERIDGLSLYCRGYADGYDWAWQQVEMERNMFEMPEDPADPAY